MAPLTIQAGAKFYEHMEEQYMLQLFTEQHPLTVLGLSKTWHLAL